MNRGRRNAALLFISVLALLTGGVQAGVITGASDYTLTVHGSIDTPARTVTVTGNDYTISSVAQVKRDASITVAVSAPTEEMYTVVVYNKDEQFAVPSKRGTGDETLTFDLNGLSSGSYMIAIDKGEFKAIHPLVIKGYDVTLQAPAEVETSETIHLSADVTRRAGANTLHSVKIVIADEQMTIQKTATKGADGTYEVTIPAEDLAPGDYRVYATGRGENEAFGRKEILGLSTAHTLSIVQSTPAGSNSQQDGSNSNTGSHATITTTQPPQTTSVLTETTQPPQTKTTERTQSTQPSSVPLSTTTTTTLSNVITANPSIQQPSSETTETNGQAGFHFLGLCGAGLLLVLLISRRIR